MRIGVPREIKHDEYRVGLTPGSVRELAGGDHQVLVESGAGAGIGVTDDDYLRAGAEICADAAAVYRSAELVVKVKEPQPEECARLRPGQTVFAYLHLAADAEQTRLLREAGVTAIAYETVTGLTHGLPLLAPMSEVAGRMAVQAGAHCLEREAGGAGVLLGGVPGVAAASVVVVGGGVVGTNAIRMAMGMGAHVTVLDRSLERLQALDQQYGCSLNTIFSTRESIEQYVQSADLVVGAVLIPGASTPKLITAEMVRSMRAGSVVVDVAVDQGGCCETTHPTTHSDPTYVVDGVVHYCVANMPGAVPRTSTFALNNATLPFVGALADHGVAAALAADSHLRAGLNVHRGRVTHPAVAGALGLPFTDADEALAA